MKRILIIITLILLGSSAQVKATHLLGGEITWQCIKSGTDAGKFIFTIKVYRACYQGAASVGSSAIIYNPLYATSGGPSTITCTRQVQRAVSPPCYDVDSQLVCGLSKGNGGTQVMEENIYVSPITTLYGTPVSTGSDFYWTSCCRPPSADMVNILTGGYYLRATMFPYTDPATNTVLSVGTSTGGPSCYDSSPNFASSPATVICYGYPFTYNHNAVDEELDSLHYEWSRPKLNVNNFVTWKSGYSTTLQLPNKNHSSLNATPTMNPLTGEIFMNVQVLPSDGYHSTGVVVEAYKCRQKVAEIYRDLPVVIIACAPYTPAPFPAIYNVPPNVVFKWNPNDNFPIPLPAGDTVWAGDFSRFYLTSTDIQFRRPGLSAQQNYLFPEGQQFGTNFSDSFSGCPYPPCAVLDTGSVFYNADSNWWEGTYGLATNFFWRTNCSHISEVNACFVKSNTYNFVFRVQDDWCAVPGMNFQTFAVTVLAPPALEPPQMKCAEVAPNGEVTLRWSQPITLWEDSLNSFRQYIVQSSDSAGFGPGVVYDTLKIIQDIDSLEFTDLSTNFPYGGRYYFVRGISSCNNQGDSILGDTISAMYLTSLVINNGNSVALDWNDYNPGNRWGPKTTGQYYIWEITGTDTVLVDSTTESIDTVDIHHCYPTYVKYMITVLDTTAIWGCVSNSTTTGDTVGDIIAPPPIALDSVSYDLNNNITLGWQHSAPDIGTYYIYKQGVQIASIPGNLNTYTYTPLPGDPKVLDFSIQAADTCMNINQRGPQQYSIGGKILDVIRCDTNKSIILSWNLYNLPWPGGVSYTHIYKSVNGSPYQLVDSVNGLDTSYVDTNIAIGHFRYRLRSNEFGSNRGAWSSWDSTTIDRFVGGTVLDPPNMRCISWVNDSTLRLNWRRPALTDTNFNRYLIYYSTNGSTFNLLDSISGFKTSDNVAWDSTEYTHVDVDTGLSHYYYVKSSSGCDGLQRSVKSNTLSAIDLTLTSVNDSTNRLNWTKISTIPTGADYEAIRDYVIPGFATPPFGTETADDILVACNKNVVYSVRYPENPNPALNVCFSESKTINGDFIDDTPPSKQFVDSVSMLRDSSFTGMVGWSKNLSKDVVGYYVMRCEGSQYALLDTIPANAQLMYLDEDNAPLQGITQYSVTGIDSCGNDQLMGSNFDCHSTIFVDASLNFCEQSVNLSWNPYTDFTSGLNVQYIIYVSVDGGPFTEAGRSDVPNYSQSNLLNDSRYCFYVQAWDNEGQGPFSSSSAVECVHALFIDEPSYAYMRYASVSSPDEARLCMRVDLNSKIGEYWVKRATERNGEYKVIATIPLPDPITAADSNFCYQDELVKTDEFSYFYKIDVADPCGVVSITSNIGRTILLNISADNEKNRNILEWNQYEEWDGKVKEYFVLRGYNSEDLVPVDTLEVSKLLTYSNVKVSGDMIAYVDDVSEEATSGNGEFCYRIVAREGTTSVPALYPEVSKSNTVCTVQYPLFYAPNSFTPNGDGLNDRFLPLGAFHDITSYQLDIFNRWGEKIYSSSEYNTPEAGWDGKYNGQDAPTGAYVYIVSYKSADGQEYEKQGTITITR